MKSPGGVVSQNQQDYLRFLAEVGFKAEVHYSAQTAVDSIREYLDYRRSVIVSVNRA